IIRRALRFGRILDVQSGTKNGTFVMLQELVPAVVKAMKGAYPDLEANQERIIARLRREEAQFTRTLENTVDRVGQVIDSVRSRGEHVLSGEEIFRLYDTFGAPLDLIAEMAEEEGVSLDHEGFETMMAGARAKA